MPNKTRDNIPALVLAVLAKVYELSGGRTHPWYVDSSTIDLIDSGDVVDLLTYYAELSGWLVGRGWRTSEERCDNGRRCTAVGGVRADLRRRLFNAC